MRIVKLVTGDYLVIGKTARTWDMTSDLFDDLKAHAASIGPGTTAVVVPAEVMHAAVEEMVTGHSGP